MSEYLLMLASSSSLCPVSLSLVFLILEGTSLSDPSAVCDRRRFFSDNFPGVFCVLLVSGSQYAVTCFLLCSDGSASIATSWTFSADAFAAAAVPSFFFFFLRFFFSSSPTEYYCTVSVIKVAL